MVGDLIAPETTAQEQVVDLLAESIWATSDVLVGCCIWQPPASQLKT